jgi:ABC-type lipoprotein release transport system permease subunit
LSEALATLPVAQVRGVRFLSLRIGWRNLWRNRRRTFLTSGGIAFSVLLVMFFMSLQFGQYAVMIDTATSLMAGQVQIQRAAYLEDSRFEDTIGDTSVLVNEISRQPHVASVAPRIEAFALVSAGERSFGAQVLGVDAGAEATTVRFTKMLSHGVGIQAPNDAVLGRILARNLGVGVGDEVVVLGSGKEGGVAALALDVVGLLETGMADLDRALLLAPLDTVQDGFGLTDEVHSLIIRLDDLDRSDAVVAELTALLPEELRVRPWQEILPELRQAIDVDKIGGQIMYWIIMVLVMFSVVNRVIGAGVGTLLAAALIFSLQNVGIYLGEEMQEYAKQFYMPARLYPGFSSEVLTVAPLAMLVGTQLAALLPSLRIRLLRPVNALRTV